jgi:hypothetical protein
MTYIDILKSLSVHKYGTYLPDSFPPSIAQIFKMLSVYTNSKTLRRLEFTPDDYMQFIINFGSALHTKNFTYEHPIKYYLDFPKEAKSLFNEKFEEFRNKQWEDILSPMLDLIEDLLKSGKVKNLPLNLY